MSSEAAAASSAPQEGQAGASTSGLPAAAKAAAELAVKTAIAESVPEEGEINEDGESNASKKNGAATNGDAAAAAGDAKDGAASGGIRTVFSDPANFNVVHPLYSKWYVAEHSRVACSHSDLNAETPFAPGVAVVSELRLLDAH